MFLCGFSSPPVARQFLLIHKPEVYFLIDKRVLRRTHKLPLARMTAIKQPKAKSDKLARRLRLIACHLAGRANGIPFQVAAGTEQLAKQPAEQRA